MLCMFQKSCTFAPSKQKDDNRSLILGYGVMVTQQILVLFFLVRVRVAQHQNKRESSRRRHRKYKFGLWCNGNTTDSGPVFLGSSPSSPTEKGVLSNRDTFFCFFFSCSLFGRSTFVTCLLSVIYGFFDTIVDFLMDVNFCRFKNKIFDIMVIKSSRLIKVIRY